MSLELQSNSGHQQFENTTANSYDPVLIAALIGSVLVVASFRFAVAVTESKGIVINASSTADAASRVRRQSWR